jgi:hypothetical protein
VPVKHAFGLDGLGRSGRGARAREAGGWGRAEGRTGRQRDSGVRTAQEGCAHIVGGMGRGADGRADRGRRYVGRNGSSSADSDGGGRALGGRVVYDG